jgi:hypothetical protein
MSEHSIDLSGRDGVRFARWQLTTKQGRHAGVGREWPWHVGPRKEEDIAGRWACSRRVGPGGSGCYLAHRWGRQKKIKSDFFIHFLMNTEVEIKPGK